MTDIEYLKKYYKGNIEDAIKKLKDGIPVQYIVGNVDFYNINVNVNQNVLIPRFETEELVEKTINYIKKIFDKNIDIIDLGTGSGCIAISIAKNIDCNMDAIDISSDALQLAKENALKNNVNINFECRDMLDSPNKKYDVLISNPPYLRENEAEEIVRNNEPNIALFATDDGMYFYKNILNNYKNNMNDKFIMAFELGYNHADYLKEYASSIYKDCNVIIENDLTGYKRFLFIIKN